MKKVTAKDFENFLANLDLKKYEKLRNIKTVEQNLPKKLNPLFLLYEKYWEERRFMDYDSFFEIYWDRNIKEICKFAKKYFYGCSLEFVQEGFKARIYRTWMSVLTQFHFQYLWEDLFGKDYPLKASAELDIKGVDSLIAFGNFRIGIQIKKISYRKEASERRFKLGRKEKQLIDKICEVPYVVIDIAELERKIKSKRVKEENKKMYAKLLSFFEKNLIKFPNGFVIFKRDYLKRVKEAIESAIDSDKDKIPYDYFL